MEKVYDDSKRMLQREMQEIANKGTMSREDLTNLKDILDNLKDISIICAMEEESGYSERNMYDSDASYARGRGSQANRDSMGRYSSRGYNYGAYDGSSYRGSYDNGYDMRQSEMREGNRRY